MKISDEQLDHLEVVVFWLLFLGVLLIGVIFK